jgi:hypothetical protein
MKKDIIIPNAAGVGIAMVPDMDDKKQRIWSAYLVNERESTLYNVFIQVSAKGELKGAERKTASVRFYVEELEPRKAKKIEIVLHQATKLSNQYWISFFDNEVLFDKKIVFEPGSITAAKLVVQDVLKVRAVYHD